MSVINWPILYINDPLVGRPLFKGQVFVGIPDLDPEDGNGNPINSKQLRVVLENGSKVDVGQPFELSQGGNPVYNGKAVRLDVDGNYSIKILNNNKVQKYYIENVFEGAPVLEADLPALVAPILINDISQPYESLNIDLLLANAIVFPVGKVLNLADRNASFIFAIGGSPNGMDILDAGNGNTAVWVAETPVNPDALGAISDGGVTDNLAIFRYALDTYWNVEAEGKYGIADTLQVFSHQRLWGKSENVRPNSPGGASLRFKWIGATNNRKAVVLVGLNDVGQDPDRNLPASTASSGCIVGNFDTDGDFKTGFGLYSVSVQNECLYHRITAQHTTECGIYIARSFYGRIDGLYTFEHENNGIALGMPLEYRDGTAPTWISTVELNRMNITDLRTQTSGMRFMNGGVDANTWDPTDPALRRRGYGLGLGVMNGGAVDNFTVEQSGGVNLYVYTSAQPIKTIEHGYLEFTAKDSGLDPASTMPNIILEAVNNQGGSYYLRDILCNFNNGGIYTVGAHKKVVLQDIQEPRFLKTLDDPILDNPEQFVSLDNCSTNLGIISKVDSIPNSYDTNIDVDTASWATFVTPKLFVGGMHVYVRPKVGFTQKGSIGYLRLDGTQSLFAWVDYMKSTPIDKWTLLFTTNTGEVEKIIGTGLATGANNVDILVEYVNPSFKSTIVI